MNEQPRKKYHRILTIAGSDSGGGAGIQADLKAISATGGYGLRVLTALTAQNTVGVSSIHPVPVPFVQQQLDAVLSDIGTDAVKIGMLFSVELIEAIAEKLDEYKVKNIVVDPVMVATSGDKLLQDDAIAALKSHLIPMADIITPNLPEAAVLLNKPLPEPEMLQEAAPELCQLGCQSVLIKGGHFAGKQSDDCLYLADTASMIALPGKRIATNNTHGTGCTLSSAIASYVGQGNGIVESVKMAKEYIAGAIEAGADYILGKGHGPVHHFYKFF